MKTSIDGDAIKSQKRTAGPSEYVKAVLSISL